MIITTHTLLKKLIKNKSVVFTSCYLKIELFFVSNINTLGIKYSFSCFGECEIKHLELNREHRMRICDFTVRIADLIECDRNGGHCILKGSTLFLNIIGVLESWNFFDVSDDSSGSLVIDLQLSLRLIH